jgi:hypothetical protein
MVIQTTHFWMVFTLEEGDILNCRIMSINKDTAMDTLAGVAENDDKKNLWYKLVHFEADGVFYTEDTGYVVLKIKDDGRIDVVGVYDQYEMIPEQIRDNELDYWIDDLEIV